MYSTLTYKDSDGDSDHLKEQGDKQEKVERPVEWVAFKNQYFSAVLIAKEAFTAADLNSRQLAEHSGYLKGFSADLEASFDFGQDSRAIPVVFRTEQLPFAPIYGKARVDTRPRS